MKKEIRMFIELIASGRNTVTVNVSQILYVEKVIDIGVIHFGKGVELNTNIAYDKLMEQLEEASELAWSGNDDDKAWSGDDDAPVFKKAPGSGISKRV